LPKLLKPFRVAASLILGVLGAGGICRPSSSGTTSGYSLRRFPALHHRRIGSITWLYLHTQGGLLLATLFHGAINSFGFVSNALTYVTLVADRGRLCRGASSCPRGLNLGRKAEAIAGLETAAPPVGGSR
jgi:hypothetical protein